MSSSLTAGQPRPARADQTEPTPAEVPLESDVEQDQAAVAEPNHGALDSQPALPAQSSPNSFPPLAGNVPEAPENNDDGDEHNENDIPYPEANEASLLPPPDFKPLFTLIEDTTTGEHHHPTVHYLFADDDQDILTHAALETLSDEQQASGDERFVIVDMSEDGREVVSVSSLSPEWQALKAKVMQAPSWGEDRNAADKGLMLRISGQEAEAVGERRQKGDVQMLLKAFDDLDGSLSGVLGSTVTNADILVAP